MNRSLGPAPANFFMTIRDVAFWVRSARADARLSRLRRGTGIAAAFDELYAGVNDPFASELPQFRYQQRKYDSLLSMLPLRCDRHVLNIGCGLGAFTRRLAPFCDRILGTDISAEGISQARKLSVRVLNASYSGDDMLDRPDRQSAFDLIVLADTLYYIEPLTHVRLASIARNISSLLVPGGLLLLVNHYFFGLDRASRRTREIHEAFEVASGLGRVVEYRRAFFLATLFRRLDSRQGATIPAA